MGTWTAAQRRNFKATMRAKSESKLVVHRFPKGLSVAEELKAIEEIIKLYGKLSQAGLNYLKSRL